MALNEVSSWAAESRSVSSRDSDAHNTPAGEGGVVVAIAM
jgi:hypothetical protein